MTPITTTAEWQALRAHADQMAGVHLRQLFADDPRRGERMAVEVGDLYLDYSKNRVTGRALELLVALAQRAAIPERIDAMFSGAHINTTEDRAVLHTAAAPPTSRPA